jgi:hypothetical protein
MMYAGSKISICNTYYADGNILLGQQDKRFPLCDMFTAGQYLIVTVYRIVSGHLQSI